MIPQWNADNDSDVYLPASLKVWNEILTGKLNYKKAYFIGMLRCEGSMGTIMKISQIMSMIIKAVNIVVCSGQVYK